ncbi:MAG: DUF885 domain-containing protein [Kofleriaceae bacterium]|nr:DUF885 domain-containing protein [Kofleriaceae bacterium]
MTRTGLFFSLGLFLSACGTTAPDSGTLSQPDKQETEKVTNASAQLSQMFAEHFEKNLELNPELAQAIGDYRFNDDFGNNLSAEYIAQTKALNDDYLARAQKLDSAILTQQEALRLTFFIYQRQAEKNAEAIPLRLLPINQFDSRANGFALSGSGEGIHPFKTEQDYRDFLTKAKGFDAWVDSAIEHMKEGMSKGIVLPKVLIERTLPQLQAQFKTELSKSTFYAPLTKIPESISGDAKTKLIADYEAGIQSVIFPAYKKLYDFMSAEYLAKGVSQHGIDAIPGGADWYQYLIGFHTTTSMKAEEIHEIGLSEVKRIRAEMDEVRVGVGFKGNLNKFFKHLSSEDKFFFASKQELIDGYSGLKAKIDGLLPKFFDVTPKTPYEVRAVESFREKSAAGDSYHAGTADGSRPGVFYINTYNLRAQPRWGMETLSLHEAAPGHHFQISIQQEMADAPKFQRFSESTAFAEGWALYVESIGKEMGLFSDPYQYFGRLSDELLRAMRLVVDTGLHSKGWSRERAIKYMLDNSAMTETDLTAEVERYMAIPAQALSYKIGQFKITELRRMAEEKLGQRFDIREFHNQVLLDGSLPMSILETKINSWIESELAAAKGAQTP